MRLHQRLSRISWYRKWHQFRYAHHVHVAALAGYVLALGLFVSASFFVPGGNVFAASGSFPQTTFTNSPTPDGTYTSTQPYTAGVAANPGNDIALGGGGGTWTQAAYENFNYAAPLNSNWTRVSGLANLAGIPTITASTYLGGGSGWGHAYYNATGILGDQKASMAMFAGTGQYSYSQVGVRQQASGGGGYYAYVYSGASYGEVQKYDAVGNSVVVTGMHFAITPVSGAVLSLAATGTSTTTLTVVYNGVTVSTGTDSSSPYTTGYTAVASYAGSNADNFYAYSSGFSASGTYLSSAIAPTGLSGAYPWTSLTANKVDQYNSAGSVAGTTAKVQIANSSGVTTGLNSYVSAGANTLGDNTSGFYSNVNTNAITVNLSAIPSASFTSLKLLFTLSTTVTSSTPLINDYSVGYTNDFVQVPQSLAISGQTTTSANLSWNTSGTIANLGYLVDRAPESSPGSGIPGTWASASGSGGTTCAYTGATYALSITARTTCTDTGLTANTKYFWRVRSVDLNNNLSGYASGLTADSNTVGLWHMDEASGNSNDGSGNVSTLTAYNTPTFVSGKLGNASNFANTTQYFSTTGNPSNLRLTGDMTIEAWVYPTNIATYPGVLGKRTSTAGTAGYSVDVLNGQIRFLLGDGGASGVTAYSAASSVPQSQWTLIGAKITGNTMQTYINGQPSGSPVTFSGTRQNPVSELYVGRHFDTATSFAGQIDEVRITNAARADSDILANYTSVGAQLKSAVTAIEIPTGVNFSAISKTGMTATETGSLTNLTTGTSGICFATQVGSCNASWQQTTSISPTAAANTQLTYYLFTRNSDSSIVNSPVGPYSRYTLAADANVTSDKTAGNWYNANPVTFTNAVGFGAGGVTKYKYVWDQTATHSFSGDGTDWTAGTLAQNMPVGSNYLHVQGYNGDSTTGTSVDYGPYKYDATAPSGTSFAWTTVNQNSLVVTLSGATDGGSGLSATPYDVQCSTASKTFANPDYDSGWVASGTLTISNLTANTAYSCRFASKDIAGNQSIWYTPGTTYKYTLIEQPSGATFSGYTSSSLTATATGTLTNIGSDASAVCFSSSPLGCTNNASDWANNVPTSYTFTGLNKGQSYTYYLLTRNGDGVVNSSVAGPYTAATLPGAPSGLSAAAISTSEIDLSWYPASGGTPNHYHLYRDGTKIEVSGTSYHDTGLAAANTIHSYYVVGVNAADGSGGQEGDHSSSVSRYTLATSPTLPSTPAVAVGNTEIDLSWTAPSDPNTLRYHVYRVVGATTTQVGGDIAGATYNDTGLAANTAYSYKIYTINADTPPVESSSYASIASYYTLPDKATGLTATAVSPTRINLTWTAMPSISKYHLFRGVTEIGGDILTNSYADTAVPVANTQYLYTVKAVNSAGDGVASDATIKYSLANAPTLPGTPAVAVGNTEIDLNWTAPSDPNTLKYHVYRVAGVTTTQVGGDIAGATYNDTGLAANTAYSYKVYTINADTPSAESSSFATISSAYTKPDKATGLTATAVSPGQINLSWTAMSGITKYHLFRGATQIGGDIATSTYGDATVPAANTQYAYTVKAVNMAGEGAASDGALRYTLANAPISSSATAVGNTEIDLSWTAPTDPNTLKYHVYRIQGAVSTPVGGDIITTTFNDIGLVANTSYSYKIYSVNADTPAVESATYATVSALPTLPDKATGLAAIAVSPTQINLTWTATAGITKYHLFRGATQIGGDIAINSYNDTAAPAANTQYSYTVKAVNAGGDGVASDAAAKYTLASIPTALQMTAAGNIAIDLSWTAPVGSGTVKYHVYRTLGAARTQVGGDINYSDLPVHDSGLSANTQYSYSVYSVNPDGVESATSLTGQKYTLTNTPVIESVLTPTNNNKPTVTNSAHLDSSFSGRTAKLFVDGSWYHSISVTAASGLFTFNAAAYGSYPLADGSHTLSAVVMSQENEASAVSNEVSVVVDTIVPVTILTNTPANPDGHPDSTYYLTNPNIALSLSNPVSNVSNSVYYKWDNNSYQLYGNPITNLAQGTHTLSWYSLDAAGNQESAHTKQYKLDTTAPTGSLSYLGGDYTPMNPVILSINATDPNGLSGSGLDQMLLSNDGVTFCPYAYANSVVWDLTGSLNLDGVYGSNCGVASAVDGARTVYAKFTDKAGNVGTESHVSLVLDSTPPTNPSSVTAAAAANSSTPLTSDQWYNYTNPVFSLNGATDNLSGVAGYFVYFGTDPDADPLSGTPQANAVFSPSLTSADSAQTFYLKVRAADNAGNFYGIDNPAASTLLFRYRFDNSAPDAINYINPTPGGWTATNNFSFTWQNVNDTGSGVSKYLYRRKTAVDTDTWESWDDTRSIDANSGDIVLSNIEALYSGVDVLQVKAIDVAGNSSAAVQVNYYYSGDIPAPANLHVNLSQSQNQTVNRFSFSWDAPNGQLSQGFYYSVNRAPDAQNSTFIPYTTGTVDTGFAAFATQTGLNTFYVVTKANDTVGWTNSAQVNFTCNTAAPGIPQNVMITDSSARDSERWQLTVNWDQPAQIAADFNGYSIERSTDGANFSEIATTSRQTTGYLDTNLLNSVTYSYRIKAKDNTGNKSAASSVISRQPTGRYTEPPKMIGDPKITVQATKAVIDFTTERDADSFVQVGTTASYGMTQGQLDSTSSHEVNLSGLTPGTFYHYRAMWRDIDSNIGYSKDYTFATQAAPGISEVNVSSIGLYSALVSWKTNTVSSSVVKYGKNNLYGSQVEDRSGSGVTVHVVKLDGLTDTTTYHFKITGTDTEGSALNSDDYSFDTLTFPRVSNVLITSKNDEATSTIVVSWNTNVPTDSVVNYSGGGVTKESSKAVLEQKHSITITNLKDNTSYSISVGGRDGYGNAADSGSANYKTPFDTRPPVITSITTETSIVGYGTDAKAQVIVSWETDEPGTSQVQYGVGVSGTDYSEKTQEDSGLTTTHVVVVSGLKPSTSYHFQVVSKDASDNRAASEDTSFLTDQASSSVLDIIVNSLQSTIGWIFGSFTSR